MRRNVLEKATLVRGVAARKTIAGGFIPQCAREVFCRTRKSQVVSAGAGA
jgi:hypothetical protein